MRVLLKISGEALKGKRDFGIDIDALQDLVGMLKRIHEKNVEIAIVIGGGNIYRGKELISAGMDSTNSHNLSMLSTVFNGVALKDFLEKSGIPTQVFDSLGINFLSKYNKDQARECLSNGKVVICIGGLGKPYFTTDSAGVLVSLELNCDFMVKATKVDGVYDSDPVSNLDAKLFPSLSYDECIEKNLLFMDATALVLAKENSLPLRVGNLSREGAIERIVFREKEGTRID